MSTQKQILKEYAEERRQVYGSSESCDDESHSSDSEENCHETAKQQAKDQHAAKQILKKKPGRPRKNIPAAIPTGEESQSYDQTVGAGKKVQEYAAQKIEDRTGVYNFEQNPDKYRKARKRQQNRESAVRSRMKKREDLEVLEDEVRKLQELLAQKDLANAELIRQNTQLQKAVETSTVEPIKKVSSVPAPRELPARPTAVVLDPRDQSHEKLDQFIRDGATSQFNQISNLTDTTSARTFVKRAKRVDSNDEFFGIQESEPYFTGNAFGNTSGRQELLSDGLFDRPESFMPAFGSNKEDFQEDSLGNHSITLSSGMYDENLSAKKQDSMEFEMVRRETQYDDYNRNIGGRSILFPLAIVFCMMCFASTGTFFGSLNFQPGIEYVATPKMPIGKIVKQGLQPKSVGGEGPNVQIDYESTEDDLEVFLTTGKRLLISLFMHWAAKFVFFFLAIVCFAEWMRTSYFAVPTKNRKQSSLRKKKDSRQGKKSRKPTESTEVH